jgi:hypothetical protein
MFICASVVVVLPIVAGINSRPTRIFWGRALTAILYAGWIIALLWFVSHAIRAVEKRMRMWAERTRSLPGKIVVPIPPAVNPLAAARLRRVVRCSASGLGLF